MARPDYLDIETGDSRLMRLAIAGVWLAGLSAALLAEINLAWKTGLVTTGALLAASLLWQSRWSAREGRWRLHLDGSIEELSCSYFSPVFFRQPGGWVSATGCMLVARDPETGKVIRLPVSARRNTTGAYRRLLQWMRWQPIPHHPGMIGE